MPWTMSKENRRLFFESKFHGSLSFVQVLRMNWRKLEQTIMQVKRESDSVPMFVRIRKKNFRNDGKDMVLLQIVDVSDSVLYDRTKSKADLVQVINACVSHDMRTPLNSIAAVNQLKQECYENLEKVSEMKQEDSAETKYVKAQVTTQVRQLKSGVVTQDLSIKMLMF